MVLVIVFPIIWESSNHSLNFASVTPVLSHQLTLSCCFWNCGQN